MELKITNLTMAGPYRVGNEIQGTGQSCSRIEMRNNGYGPMGFYDVIYIYGYGEKPLRAMPAHNTDIWEFAHENNL